MLILVGSPNDLPKLEAAERTLAELGLTAETRVASAHRDPELLAQIVGAADRDPAVWVIIAAAGMAAHLAGAAASRTVKPVIGVPLSGSALGGVDALYATVQMPRGVPVATVAVDGAANAAYLAAEIISLSRPATRERLVEARRRLASEARAPGAG